nr:uncharacterized protein LOC112705764 isoform X3 [Arachis hypogaea]
MLFMCRPPSILQFPKILGSLAKTNHCPTAISLFQQLQSRKMEKKREIVELYKERLDNTLASPHMTKYHMLKNLVQTQLLHSSKQQGRTEFGFQRWEWLMVDEVQNDQTATA